MCTDLYKNLDYLDRTFKLSHVKTFSSHSTKDTKIFSTNKMLKTYAIAFLLLSLCISYLSRCQDGSGSGSGNAPLDQRFLLKWSVPLSFVEVLEFGSSEDMSDSSRYPAPHSGEKVVINAKPSMYHSVTFSYFISVCCFSICQSRKKGLLEKVSFIRACQVVENLSFYRL